MVIKFDPGLYIVAGPIGNLSDLTPRAAELLRNADIIAVEDSRVSAQLLRHAGSERPMVAHDDHSHEKRSTQLFGSIARTPRGPLCHASTHPIPYPGYKWCDHPRASV